MKFFLDNCISRVLAESMAHAARAQDIEVHHLQHRFPPAVTDLQWISTLRAEGDWIILSGDMRLTRNPAEQAAWHESGLTAFFFSDGFANKRFWTQFQEMVRWFPIITLTAKDCVPGSGYRLPFQGSEPKLIYSP